MSLSKFAAEVRRLSEAATPGPWVRNLYLGGSYAIDRIAPNGDRISHVADVRGSVFTGPNSEVIPYLRNHASQIAALADLCERAEPWMDDSRAFSWLEDYSKLAKEMDR